jgi:hypothetical protein
VPPLDAPTSSGHIEDEQEASSELLEWIGLSAIDSERHHEDDRIDPYLSRYQVPMGDQGATDHLVSLRWRGFLESDWVRRLFMELLYVTTGGTLCALLTALGWRPGRTAKLGLHLPRTHSGAKL